MDRLRLTPKLQDYIQKTEVETSRKIKFINTPEGQFPISGGTCALALDAHDIVVLINSDKVMSAIELERSVAHELTHALLMYKRGYGIPVGKRDLTVEERIGIGLLISMIDDIAVDYIICKEGFPPFSENYVSQIQKSTQDMRSGIAYRNTFPNMPALRDKFIIMRYVTAWGYINYFNLDPNSERILKAYLKLFNKTFTAKYKIASYITKLISQNDIFTAEGRNTVVEAVLKNQKLEDLVELNQKLESAEIINQLGVLKVLVSNPLAKLSK